ncbi:hypothetical protein [Nitriliruptor alkaliphilus]|uniref:hypothetical protein n=1 Tax=Nitriliruptor alkaliphilus TaxID=427918 RepID=UPI0006968CD9|nr:hypothetical protein [Nitriliruptor alkaliphilus]
MRVRRVVAAIAVVSTAVVGCSSEGDDGALDLDELEATAAPPDVRPGPPDDVPDEPDEPTQDEQLYPPLPPLEADPDSEISVETQEFFLELHAGAYEASQRSFATASVDPDLDRYFGGDALAEIEATVASWAAEGLVERSPDSEVRWVTVHDQGDGVFVVAECSVAGPDTGLYDASSGEPVEVIGAATAMVIETAYGLMATDTGPEYRAVAVTAGEDQERCGEE